MPLLTYLFIGFLVAILPPFFLTVEFSAADRHVKINKNWKVEGDASVVVVYVSAMAIMWLPLAAIAIKNKYFN